MGVAGRLAPATTMQKPQNSWDYLAKTDGILPCFFFASTLALASTYFFNLLMPARPNHIENYEKTLPLIRAQADSLTSNFFSATKLLANIQ